jgi:hypothetical protein
MVDLVPSSRTASIVVWLTRINGSQDVPAKACSVPHRSEWVPTEAITLQVPCDDLCFDSPSLSIPNLTTSPAFRYCGGFMPNPTPAGVPVLMTSPGSKVITG